MKIKLLTLSIATFLILSLAACSTTDTQSSSTSSTSSSSEVESSVSSSEQSVSQSENSFSNSNYLTETTWAALDNYMFAVEVPEYSGDIFEAGKYLFSATDAKTGEIPIIWDIYVSSEQKSSLSELEETELVGSVGGLEKSTIEYELQSGQYVYVVYNKTLGTPGGMLKISKQ